MRWDPRGPRDRSRVYHELPEVSVGSVEKAGVLFVDDGVDAVDDVAVVNIDGRAGRITSVGPEGCSEFGPADSLFAWSLGVLRGEDAFGVPQDGGPSGMP